LRKLLATVLVLALLAAVLSVVDVVVRHRVETTIAQRIEAKSPGSHAVVTISSFPFLGYLAVAGRVPSLRADITGVTDGSLHIERIDLQVKDLKVSRSKLLHGQVQVQSIRRGTVVAEISQSAFDALTHVPVTLGQGTIGVAGINVGVHATITPGAVSLALGHGLPDIRIPVSELDILPCVGSAQVLPGVLRLSCTFKSLPGFLSGTTFS
jgi:hypothetical protein